ncbi:hypothetical protein CC1G_13800 [Coprinopsis cinerea okayama7|uniref:Uncharacterized protein n=1 Tax=Coprinopsis cinerea (strain Okayama-7 / 130 / ATCC MYA-4618 / FGSC 9003) TaxID=240176 RepID=D6RKC9_COPC7|nr:hypothetical protein CC1G_13800 [Coprinopsis cinerea okayama7\|eukprot:XP_002912269.1 hypothetical protein CC1G_13800 [Coprinopsis cinerea okayama7\
MPDGPAGGKMDKQGLFMLYIVSVRVLWYLIADTSERCENCWRRQSKKSTVVKEDAGTSLRAGHDRMASSRRSKNHPSRRVSGHHPEES